MWCTAAQRPLFIRTRHFTGVSCVGGKLPTVMAGPCLPSVHSTAVAHFACCRCVGHSLVPVLLKGHPEAAGGLSGGVISQTRCLSSAHLLDLQLHQTAGCSPWRAPQRLSFMGRACSQTDVCPNASAGAVVVLVCVVISPLSRAGVTSEWCWSLLDCLRGTSGRELWRVGWGQVSR